MKTAHLLFIFLAALIYYFSTPLLGDIYVFLGSAHLAEIQYGGGLLGALHSWELKPFANRILVYGIYKLASLFSSFDDKASFPTAVRAAYLGLIFSAAWGGAQARAWFFPTVQILQRFSNAFLLFAALFLTTSYCCILQAEFSALLLAFTSLGLLVSRRWWFQIPGVLVLSFVPFFKGSSLVYAAQLLVVIGFYGMLSRAQFVRVGLGFATGVVAIALSLHSIYPQELRSFFDAVLFQAPLQASFGDWIEIVFVLTPYFFVQTFTHFPLWAPSIVLAVALFFVRSRKTPRTHFTGILLAGLGGLGAIALEHKFFVYHFTNIIFPFFLLFFVVLENWERFSLKMRKAGIAVFSISTVIFLLNTSVAERLLPENSFVVRYPLSEWDYVSARKSEQLFRDRATAAKDLGIKADEKVLYLDAGVGPWILGAPSACRHFFPLPVQRVFLNPKLFETEAYRLTVDCFNSFKGRYVYFDGWLKVPERPELEKFRSEFPSNFTQIPNTPFYVRKTD